MKVPVPIVVIVQGLSVEIKAKHKKLTVFELAENVANIFLDGVKELARNEYYFNACWLPFRFRVDSKTRVPHIFIILGKWLNIKSPPAFPTHLGSV